jgi:hypothetical protein
MINPTTCPKGLSHRDNLRSLLRVKDPNHPSSYVEDVLVSSLFKHNFFLLLLKIGEGEITNPISNDYFTIVSEGISTRHHEVT